VDSVGRRLQSRRRQPMDTWVFGAGVAMNSCLGSPECHQRAKRGSGEEG
jgi:hypothetical protein